MTKTKIAARMERIVPFYVMDLLAKAKELEAQGRSIIHMEVGEPDFTTPRPVVDAGKKALDDGRTGYTAATGIPQLRQAISSYYQQSFGLGIDPARIVVTPGSSGALQLVLSVLVDPGQEVLMTDPGYPCNKNFVELVSGVPVGLPVGAETRYQLNSEQVAENWRAATRAVMVATPSNPTGTVVERDEMMRIHRQVMKRGGALIVDEIYQGLMYGKKPYSALELSEDLFVINSFSKYFGMTGWRLGWIVAPECYVESLDTLAQNLFLSCPSISQYAALEAFSPPCREILENRRVEFQRRRDFLVPALKSLGFKIPVMPEGAFYLYADSSSLTDDSFKFAYDLLENQGVAITPGKDFGAHKPERHVRFAYTNSIENMTEAVRRIGEFLSTGPQ
jgi:aspartate/methionine/tyrosine aminotransferase